jgi:hypothetical protein
MNIFSSALAPLPIAIAIGLCSCSVPEAKSVSAAPQSAVVIATATIRDPSIREISALAASRRNQGVFWTYDSRGQAAQLLAVDSTGAVVARPHLEGAERVDWKGIATGQGPDLRSTIYIGDIGDKARARASVVIYRVAEPLISSSDIAAKEVPIAAEAEELHFPSGARDCDALLRDALSSRIYLISRHAAGPSLVFAADANAAVGTHAELDDLGAVNWGPTAQAAAELAVTAGSISSDGTTIALRTSTFVAEWRRDRTERVEVALKRRPERTIGLRGEGSAALTYGPDASIFLSGLRHPPVLLRIEPMGAGAWGAKRGI